MPMHKKYRTNMLKLTLVDWATVSYTENLIYSFFTQASWQDN
jgi:hypothetical protein